MVKPVRATRRAARRAESATRTLADIKRKDALDSPKPAERATIERLSLRAVESTESERLSLPCKQRETLEKSISSYDDGVDSVKEQRVAASLMFAASLAAAFECIQADLDGINRRLLRLELSKKGNKSRLNLGREVRDGG